MALMLPLAAHATDAGPTTADFALMRQADVVVLGETHDNPTHHHVQAEIIADLQPRALVVEMLTPDEASDLVADPAGYSAQWSENGWPDYAMYLPIFTASDALVYGAGVTREVARASYKDGVAAHFEGDVQAFGLSDPLPTDQHDQRIELQFDAHCEAMPRVALGGMVEVQRLRDATLARVTLEALQKSAQNADGPVVVITGNGHARADWGVASYLQRVQPGLRVISVGQSEDGVRPEGGFDLVYDAPAVIRDDPCDAFK
ncbi:ChaN family lipoprotein [Aliiroseovarius sp. 2305UL8-7]|uniref:ChaN family lipoprotein n=1 Tax=Aliiroseovarius conchicola TaxID=3121637 RepID=UPI003527841D